MRNAVPITDPPIEIIGPDGKVHYRRSPGHPDIIEALRTPGYCVAGPREHFQAVINGIFDSETELECQASSAAGRFTLVPKATSGAPAAGAGGT